jgi:hypothetical protein
VRETGKKPKGILATVLLPTGHGWWPLSSQMPADNHGFQFCSTFVFFEVPVFLLIINKVNI